MKEILNFAWQTNAELSLLLIAIISARSVIKNLSQDKNTYPLWLTIPLVICLGWCVNQFDFFQYTQAPAASLIVQNYLVQPYVVQPSQIITNHGYIFAIWMTIVAFLLARLALQHIFLQSQLRDITSKERIAVQSKYGIVPIESHNFSPAVYGFLKPKIYFPIHLLDELTPQQISLIIKHEEHHIQQGHLWLNLLWDIATAAMWFNPIVYLARKQFRHDQELHCDQLVLQSAKVDQQKAYGKALLSTISATHSLSLLCPWKSIHQIEERIMNIKKKKQVNNKLAMGLLATLIISGTSLYSVSAHENEQDHQREVEKKIKVYKFAGDHAGKPKQVKIKIIKDGLTYSEENGEKFVMENGKKRELTQKELKLFEREIEKAHEHASAYELSGENHQKGHKQIRIIRDIDGADLDFDINELEIEEFEKMARDMADIDFEIKLNEDQFSMAEHELRAIEKEIESAHEAKKISKSQNAKAAKQIKKAREKLVKEQEKMKLALKKTRAEVERLRTEMLESRAR